MGDTVRTPRRDVAPEVADSRGRPKPERSFCRKVPEYSPMAGFALTAAGWNPRWVRPVTATIDCWMAIGAATRSRCHADGLLTIAIPALSVSEPPTGLRVVIIWVGSPSPNGAGSQCPRASVAGARAGARCPIVREEGGGGLAVFAQGITPFSPSMAAREARLRPCGPASPIDSCAAA